MTETRDDFEQRLTHGLREWTNSVDRPRPWLDEAHRVITEASMPRRPSRFVLITLGFATTLAAVFLGLIIVVLTTGRDVEHPSPIGSSPSTSASIPTTPLPEASTVPASELDLSQLAWWDLQAIGFGIIPEDPLPSPAVTPMGFRQIRIGTLDGRVTAMLAVSGEWGHSYVSGPVDGEVLVVDDNGTRSTIRAIDAADGSISHLLSSRREIITAAALAPGVEGFYYAKVDRATGLDLGVWYRALGGAERLVDNAPSDFGLAELSVWQLAVSPDGATLIAQFCFGAVRCTTDVIDLLTGDSGETTSISWLQGFAGREVLAFRIGPAGHKLVALNLDTLEVKSADVTWPDSLDRERPGTFGVELPAGWLADWPEITGDSLGQGPPPAPVRLRNVVTGEEVTTPALTLAWPTDCEPIPPAEMPSGKGVGPFIRTLEDGVRWARFGSGDDLVVQSMGPGPGDPPGDQATPVAIRGHDGYLEFAITRYLSPDVPGPTIQWTQDGCWYRIALPALTPDEAAEYAGRF